MSSTTAVTRKRVVEMEEAGLGFMSNEVDRNCVMHPLQKKSTDSAKPMPENRRECFSAAITVILPRLIARLRRPLGPPGGGACRPKKSASPTVADRGPEKPDKDTEGARPYGRVLAGDALS